MSNAYTVANIKSRFCRTLIDTSNDNNRSSYYEQSSLTGYKLSTIGMIHTGLTMIYKNSYRPTTYRSSGISALVDQHGSKRILNIWNLNKKEYELENNDHRLLEHETNTRVINSNIKRKPDISFDVTHVTLWSLTDLSLKIYDFKGDNQNSFNKILKTHLDPSYIPPRWGVCKRLFEIIRSSW
jgi:hypothetical protein